MVRIVPNSPAYYVAQKFANLSARQIVAANQIPLEMVQDFGPALQRGDYEVKPIIRCGQESGCFAGVKQGRVFPITFLSCEGSRDSYLSPATVSLRLWLHMAQGERS